jgi:hypothetical protein
MTSRYIALDETKSLSELLQTLFETVRPSAEQLVRIATAKYRESIHTSTKDVLAWFTKWDEAMALAEKV